MKTPLVKFCNLSSETENPCNPKKEKKKKKKKEKRKNPH
jgi:hypothetical protein